MNKEEFENLANVKVTVEEYELIEFAYMWYPTITDTNGKNQIVALFKAGGMQLIKDMQQTAKKAKKLDSEIVRRKQEIYSLEVELNKMKK